MKLITVRVPDDIASFVARTARKRNVKETVVWRELINRGVNGSDQTQEKLDLILRSSIQALTIGRRVAGTMDEDLVALAAEDAKTLIHKYLEES